MEKKSLKSILFLIILSIIWGTSFILIKKGLLAFSPGQVGALRIVIAAVIFLPYIIKTFKSIRFDKYKYIITFGLLEIGIPPFLYAFAQTVVNSSTAGILNSLVPLFTLLIGIILFKKSTNLLKIVGVLLGFLGAVFLLFFKSGDLNSIDFANSYGLLIVLATLMYGFGSHILKEFLQEVSDVQITAVSFVSVGIPAVIYLYTTGFFSLPLLEAPYLSSFGAIATLSIFGSALAIVLFSMLVRSSNALFASFVTYLIPFVALGWGFLDGEGITLIQIFCMLLILLGIYLANYKKSISN